MSHLHRFYNPEPLPTNTTVLTGQEAHHALHVVRLRAGDRIELFDGQGHESDATVTETTRHEVHLQITARRDIPQPTARLTIFQACLHRDKAVEELIRHGTEIGVASFVFFRAHHSERLPRVNDKWQRTAIEACKQCRRAWLPAFNTTNSLDDALAMASGDRLVATQNFPPATLRDAITSQDVSLFVGPEGDFTQEELTALTAHNAKAISLGPATYRSEVCAVLASTLILYELGQFATLPSS